MHFIVSDIEKLLKITSSFSQKKISIDIIDFGDISIPKSNSLQEIVESVGVDW